MGLIEKRELLAKLAPPLDHFLTTQLLDEFISLERRFVQRDWEPAELDGGQFCEVLARILYHQDSGTLNRTKGFNDCAEYIEIDRNSHAIAPRQDGLHLIRVLRTVYKFRSQRGSVHISPTYTPNHMDAKLIIENVRWALNETLRVFWQGDREKVAKAIREVLQFDVPAVGVFESIVIVQRTDLTAEEEILVLLHYAGETGFSRSELGRYVMCAPATITAALQKLTSTDVRQVVLLHSGKFRLTDLGSRRIREHLADKLLLE
jgi:hypothetical protein